MSLPDIFVKGGPLMYLILLCSITALAVAMERLLKMHSISIDEDKLLEEVGERLKQNDIVGAIEVCENAPGPVATVCKKGLLKYDRPTEEIKEAMEDAALHEIPELERRLPVLATIAHISPLLGLLGTVTGMIKAFYKIQQLATEGRPVEPGSLAAGIWEALITTAFGLVVAIPTFVAYNYLVSKVNDIVTRMERCAAELMNMIEGEKG